MEGPLGTFEAFPKHPQPPSECSIQSSHDPTPQSEDLTAWARDVGTVLSEEHQKDVRYWRRAETGGRYAAEEGYASICRAQ